MSDALTSLRLFMPEWMAHKAIALLGALPEEVRRWVEETAGQVAANPVPPGRDPWDEAIVQRFADRRRSKDQKAIVQALSGAVLAVAIQKLPAPVLTSDIGGSTDIRSTKELDLPAVKRSRILGMLEPCLAAYDEKVEGLLRSLAG